MNQHPFLFRRLQGAIGKKWVVKHYKGNRIVLTKYPDMTHILPSQSQKHRRRLFKKAVAYAAKIFQNPILREEKRRLLRRPHRLFQALVKEWFRTRKEKEYNRQKRIRQWQKTWQRTNALDLVTFTKQGINRLSFGPRLAYFPVGTPLKAFDVG